MRFVRDLFVLVGIALAFVFFVAGCGNVDHNVHHNAQTMKHSVEHKDQNIHHWIHGPRDARRHAPPAPE